MTNPQHTTNPTPTRLLYTLDEARAQLGNICRQSMYNLVHSGLLPSVMIGTKRLIRHTDLEAFLEAQLSTVGERGEPLKVQADRIKAEHARAALAPRTKPSPRGETTPRKRAA
jgi:excisionase family DNA binding protein